MKYDIGIQTFWNVPNYGTFVQAYALHKELQHLNVNKDIRQIAHLDQHHYNFYYNKKAYMREFPMWKKMFWKSFLTNGEKINEKEKVFLNAYDEIPHTETINKSNVQDFCFEKVFLGSDIVWDFCTKVFNDDPMLFGIGFNGEINSYAASFGTVPVDAEIPKYIETAIKKMKNISVRDEKSAEIVNRITGIYPTVVLDPTWLWDFNSDEKIIKSEENDYILVYGQDFTKEFIYNLVEYAQNRKKKIIALDCNDDHYEWCDKMINQSKLTPFQWIGYFKHATAVATSTFHGITFSLIFNKKFAFCKTDFIMAKVDNFLKDLDLYDLYDKSQNNVKKMFEHDFRYSNINEIIRQKREKSVEFLRKACDIQNGRE